MESIIICECGNKHFLYMGLKARCTRCLTEYATDQSGTVWIRRYNKKKNAYEKNAEKHDRVSASKETNAAEDLINIQGAEGNWDMDPYMSGVYNGMILIQSTYTNISPKFREGVSCWACFRRDLIRKLKFWRREKVARQRLRL